MSNNKIKLAIASAYSAILNVVFVTAITIWAELYVPLKDWLKSVSGHHWTTKSIFSVVLFALFLIIFYFTLSDNEKRIRNALRNLLVIVVLGVLALTLFFSAHHFGVF
ncbi:MAG: hypothetical protein A2749_00250 [Parcubacteria group bacterium RIFCSPHIGHO2_01_FULL_45_26]|nr:MAG: hypothetical protein A2749_00250 [Parcubacteria group bacterium RIFCSPHIGHO2_01_FULL_45_26]